MFRAIVRVSLVAALALGGAGANAQVFSEGFETGGLCPWSNYSCLTGLSAVVERVVGPEPAAEIGVCVPTSGLPSGGILCRFSTCDSGALGCQVDFRVDQSSGFFGLAGQVSIDMDVAAGQEIEYEYPPFGCLAELSGSVNVTLSFDMEPPCSDTRLAFDQLGDGASSEQISFDGTGLVCLSTVEKFVAMTILSELETELRERYETSLQGETYCEQ